MSTYFFVVLLATIAAGSAATLGDMASNACAVMKDMMGISFTKLLNKDDNPDFNVDELTVDFVSNGKSKTYNITTAAKDILADKMYNEKEPLYMFIHGWNSDATGSNGITDALNAKGHNVLALDSSKYLKTWDYLKSSSYVMFIGKKLAEVLVGLNEVGLDRKNMHLIGHSLGAQISGFVGTTFQNLTGTKIGRISGLDPAGPCFSQSSADYQLSSDDADFVDVIHSNAGLAGVSNAVGHVDFYPNGGSNQPGCFKLATCDHGRSMSFYAESINDNEAFPAWKSDSWDLFQKGDCEETYRYMGFGAKPDNNTGSYYLHTTSASPFGLGLKGLTAESFNVLKFLFGK